MSKGKGGIYVQDLQLKKALKFVVTFHTFFNTYTLIRFYVYRAEVVAFKNVFSYKLSEIIRNLKAIRFLSYVISQSLRQKENNEFFFQ